MQRLPFQVAAFFCFRERRSSCGAASANATRAGNRLIACNPEAVKDYCFTGTLWIQHKVVLTQNIIHKLFGFLPFKLFKMLYMQDFVCYREISCIKSNAQGESQELQRSQGASGECIVNSDRISRAECTGSSQGSQSLGVAGENWERSNCSRQGRAITGGIVRQLIAQQRDQLAYHEAQTEKIKQGLKDLEALLEHLQEETGEEEEEAD